ncbi:hypothetical protein CTI12_AA555630 [Artemisia annua]|uniref:DUF4283 domain-containing protein n=1 Tax=Artemisia annua TaxID=35608 RepID=A0A2U1KWX5_ARTAN|nr:hypothetical protein CTI12_AA555630 [Artemisia annua]
MDQQAPRSKPCNMYFNLWYPAQLWFSNPFKPIAELWGKILIHEDCSSRQFNRTVGKVCILTDHLDLIKYKIQIPIENEVFMVDINKTKEGIDSLFNGYVLLSSLNDEDSSDEEDDQRSDGQANADSEKENNNDSDNIHLSGNDSSTGWEN